MQCQPSIYNSEYEKDVPLSVIQTQKSAYELSGPSGPSLCQFLQHEATRSISTCPWMECLPIAGCFAQGQFPWPGLETGVLDPDMSELSIRPPHFPILIHKSNVSFFLHKT